LLLLLTVIFEIRPGKIDIVAIAVLAMEDIKERIRFELSESYLEITKEDPSMFDNIDSFVALSRENTRVQLVVLYPFDSDPGNYEVWDKVGQMVGNLMELQRINIHFSHYNGEKTGRYSLESCGIYGLKFIVVWILERNAVRRVKISKV
jgi:hypothetical protein